MTAALGIVGLLVLLAVAMRFGWRNATAHVDAGIRFARALPWGDR